MRKMLTLGGLVLIVITIGAFVFLRGSDNFSNAPSSGAPENRTAAVAVPFTSLARGSRSRVATRVNYLITSANDLANLWKIVDATSTPPAVDFKTQAVLAVFAGKESSSAIAVAKIEDTNERVVSVTVTKLDGACLKKLSALSPYEIVVVPATSLPLAHQDLSTTARCPE